MSLTDSIAQAIAKQEGFYVPNSLAQRNNNPGNLRTWGSNPIVSGYAQFATPDAGWNALYSQIQTNINRGLTLNEFFAGKPGLYPGYSPSADQNSPIAYANFVSQHIGIDPNIPLNTLGDTSPPFYHPPPTHSDKG